MRVKTISLSLCNFIFILIMENKDFNYRQNLNTACMCVLYL